MAKLEITRARINLNREEQTDINLNMERLANGQTESLTRSMREDFKQRNKFRTRLDGILSANNVNLKQLRGEVNNDYKALDQGYVAKVKKVTFRKKKNAITNAVWGLTSGVDHPPYDLNWTHHNIDGTPLDYATAADPNTGYISTYAHGHDSSPKMVDAYAGVGFWYIPNRAGVLHIGTGPSLNELMWTGANWNDVGAAGGWISLGIASYLRRPFRFVRWEVIKTDLLWWNEDNWFDFTTHDRDTSSYGMSVDAIADTEHYYACWQWIRSYAYAENGGSYAGSSLTANLGGFTYSFL